MNWVVPKLLALSLIGIISCGKNGSTPISITSEPSESITEWKTAAKTQGDQWEPISLEKGFILRLRDRTEGILALRVESASISTVNDLESSSAIINWELQHGEQKEAGKTELSVAHGFQTNANGIRIRRTAEGSERFQLADLEFQWSYQSSTGLWLYLEPGTEYFLERDATLSDEEIVVPIDELDIPPEMLKSLREQVAE